jgi:hypothetical protein
MLGRDCRGDLHLIPPCRLFRLIGRLEKSGGVREGYAAMFIRDALIASLLGIFGYASTACANSCANVDVIGSFDESGLRESEFGISAAGTFRIAGEGDESKQPMFNLTTNKTGIYLVHENAIRRQIR